MKENWKLICRNKEGSSDSSINLPFIDTFEELKEEIQTINSGGYSYNIVDFELVKISIT